MTIQDRIKLVEELTEIEKKTGKQLSGGIQHLTDDDLEKMVEKLRNNYGK
jgi:DNA repair photolyase